MLTRNRSGSHVDLVRLDQALDLTGRPNIDLNSKHTLESAHGEEIVRAIAVDHQVRDLQFISCNS